MQRDTAVCDQWGMGFVQGTPPEPPSRRELIADVASFAVAVLAMASLAALVHLGAHL